jgi:hygromycin-B 7''-O-kinase
MKNDVPGRFELMRRETGLGLEVARAIAGHHGFSTDCAIVTLRSQLVFSVAGRHIIKVFSPEDTDFHKTETVFLKGLQGRLPLRTPELAASGRWDGLPYIIMEQLQGVPLDRIWDDLQPGERDDVMEQLGQGIRCLHSLPGELLSEAPFEWHAFIDHQQAALVANHRAFGLEDKWLEMLVPYLGTCPLDAHDPDRIGPLHTELMPEHIFVTGHAGSWTISGLIDFEPSMVGHAEYEFAAVGVFLSRGDRCLLRRFLTVYGYRCGDLNRELSRRMMGFLLLHRYSNLKWFMASLPDKGGFARLEDLEQYWFGL